MKFDGPWSGGLLKIKRSEILHDTKCREGHHETNQRTRTRICRTQWRKHIGKGSFMGGKLIWCLKKLWQADLFQLITISPCSWDRMGRNEWCGTSFSVWKMARIHTVKVPLRLEPPMHPIPMFVEFLIPCCCRIDTNYACPHWSIIFSTLSNRGPEAQSRTFATSKTMKILVITSGFGWFWDAPSQSKWHKIQHHIFHKRW